jgi:crotonobetainyl-CoA:carnitine CoA-transferase CaiB-like acyl-CoA transferase
VTILDFTQLEQGPSGTQILADFGADVIKIERLDTGEMGREQQPRLKGMSCHWAANNRNKRSLSIDLKDERGIGIILDLVERADIVASNFRPGVMDRLGLGYEQLKERNPRIISAYASGYGQDGPYQHRRGQDLAAQAMGGVMALTGEAGGPPTAVGTFAIDYLAAMHFAQGMMAALAARERTGEGQVVDACLLSSAVAMHLQEGTAYLNTGRRYPRTEGGIAHAHHTSLYATYRTADDRYLALVGEFYVDRPWWRVCSALDLDDDVASDPRFETLEGVLEHGRETSEILREAFEKFSLDEAIERLESYDVLTAPVNEYPEVFNDPQVLHNGMVLETEHAGVGPIKLVGMPVKLSATPGQLRVAPPTVGEHNEQILADLGFTPGAIEELQSLRVVGQENVRQQAGGDYAW